MRLAHLADLHLGFRMGAELTPSGQYQREVDVANAFRWVVDDLIQQRPDVVVVAGDLFHLVRPTNQALLVALSGFQRLKVALPHTDVLIVSGDHDTPRTSETTPILGMLKLIGATVHQGPTLLEADTHNYRFLLCPSGACRLLPRWDGFGTGSGHEGIVLVCHGEDGEYGGVEERVPGHNIPRGTLERPWTYAALGDHHVAKQVGERAWYAGSIDYTSSDPWGELAQQKKLGRPGKGYLLVDLPTGEPVFRCVDPPPRRFVDLPSVYGENLGPVEVTDLILEQLATAPDGACVRLKVVDVPRLVRKELDWDRIRPHKERLLSVNIRLYRPTLEYDPAVGAMRGAARQQNLEEILRSFLTDRGRELGDGLDVDAFVNEGMGYYARTSQDPA